MACRIARGLHPARHGTSDSKRSSACTLRQPGKRRVTHAALSSYSEYYITHLAYPRQTIDRLLTRGSHHRASVPKNPFPASHHQS